MNNGPRIFDDAPDHVCEIDCQLVVENGTRKHIMYQADPNSAAGRYQYDRNREIYTMGKGARAAMRATGQSDTRNNREWNYARKLFKDAADLAKYDDAPSIAQIDADYRDSVNAVFGPDRRPYVKRSIRSTARLRKFNRVMLGRAQKHGLALNIDRPPFNAGSEHDPNL